MNQKILWKIESCWDTYKNQTQTTSDFSLEYLYDSGISIFNPNFKMVSKFNFTPSLQPVHRDDYGKYRGIEHSQVAKIDGKYVYVFDNHNKILQPFLEYSTVMGQGFDVVHIDAHSDDAVFPAEKPRHITLEKITDYIEQTRISDFFDFVSNVVISDPIHDPIHVIPTLPHVIPAKAGIQNSPKISEKMIKNIHRYATSRDFTEFKKPENPYILSLDIDIFGPEGDFVDIESKINIIADAWSRAGVVCIATSPGFIDQDFAEGIIRIFVKEKKFLLK